MRMLAKDVAKTLGVSEAPLLESLRGETLCPYIFEESEDKEQDMRCDYYCQRPDAPAVTQRCCQPVFWAAGKRHKRCTEHMYATANIKPIALPTWIAQATDDLDEEHEMPVAFRTSENLVVDGTGTVRGIYTPESKRRFLFIVEDE
jgi:hypothetical protein